MISESLDVKKYKVVEEATMTDEECIPYQL